MTIAETGAKNGASCPSTSVAITQAAPAATPACSTERHDSRNRSSRVRIETRERSAASSISGAARSLSGRTSLSFRRGMAALILACNRKVPARAPQGASGIVHTCRSRLAPSPLGAFRFVLAVAASVILAGLAAVLISKRLETDRVIWTMVVGPVAAAMAWLALQLHRANLLGNAVRVTPEGLPELHSVLEEVRDRLAYHRRVDVYVTDRVSGLMSLTSLFGTRIIMIEGDLVATLLSEGRRSELTFLVARFIGVLRASATGSGRCGARHARRPIGLVTSSSGRTTARSSTPATRSASRPPAISTPRSTRSIA